MLKEPLMLKSFSFMYEYSSIILTRKNESPGKTIIDSVRTKIAILIFIKKRKNNEFNRLISPKKKDSIINRNRRKSSSFRNIPYKENKSGNSKEKPESK